MSSSDTCIHRDKGLCPDCQAERDADPQAWEEYGRHAKGEARWAALQAEMRAAREELWAETAQKTSDDVPF